MLHCYKYKLQGQLRRKDHGGQGRPEGAEADRSSPARTHVRQEYYHLEESRSGEAQSCDDQPKPVHPKNLEHWNCNGAAESGPPPLCFQLQGNRDAPQESKGQREVVPEAALDDRGDDCRLSGVLEGDTNIMCFLDYLYIYKWCFFSTGLPQK